MQDDLKKQLRRSVKKPYSAKRGPPPCELQMLDRIAVLEAKLAEKDALIEHVGGDVVTKADREAAARLNGYANWSVWQAAPQHDAEWMELCAHDFARHRQAAFADGFSAALQGAEAAIWRIEDDAFLYENVSKALQEVISELQAMEQNWTGRATIEHRQAAIKERDAQIVAKLRKTAHSLWERDHSDESFTVEYLADAIEQGEV